jgi:tRNA(adenine34) deaminase
MPQKSPQPDAEAMRLALIAAAAGARAGEAPIGAVVTLSGKIISVAHNLVEALPDPTAHAEALAIRAAARMIGAPRLPDCDLFVTLEPCAMCAGAIEHARIRRLVFGAYDPKGGGVDHGARVFQRPTCRHRPDIISGVQETEAAALLKDFFAGLRSP